MAPTTSRTTKNTAKKPTSRPGAKAKTAGGSSPSETISARIADLADWRGETLARMRRLILEADPDMVEEIKWIKPSNPWGVPVWSHDGIVCTGEVYKQAVKLTFAKGATVPDPRRLFNASMEGGTRRAIDIHEGDNIDARAFKALVKAAAARNAPQTKPVARSGGKRAVLLSGGNPQIAKAEGDAPVQAYIAVIPGWKRDIGKQVDALITRTVPGVRKAVKWNSPFYGVEGKGWFLSFHVFARYAKVTFFAGASLRPMPPGAGKDEQVRWIDVDEGGLDEAQMEKWVKQAARLPGWDPSQPR